tara:strand:+ start:169 stop:876 length:708 start_codon:yes stop_codon:yes gene_type:complete
MKNTILGLTLFLFYFQSNAQQITWQCSNVIIENPAAFVSVWDDFMQTDIGKSMSANAIFQFDHVSSEFSSTHQICWFSDNAADIQGNFAKFMNAKFMNTAGIYETWNENVVQESTVLGQSLIADPAGFDLEFAVVYMINVQDPAGYAAAFTKMKAAAEASNDGQGTLELHEVLAGGESGVTHEVIVRAPSMAEWLANRNEFFSSEIFQEFVQTVRPFSDILHVLTGSPVKFYNVD